MSQVISDIKSKVSIEELVSQYVVLKKVGRTLKGLCPFHAEKTPSFIVSPDKGICWCFGCNKGGDIFNFLMEVENLEFNEVLKILAERVGVDLENHKPADRLKKSDKMLMVEVNEAVTLFYEEKLWQTKKGDQVMEYLLTRGLTEQTIKMFKLGYAPDSFSETNNFLLKKNFFKSKIIQVGLALSKDISGSSIYDRFRGRLMFPVMNGLGKVVGFGGRALTQDQEPKYLNTPETKLYQKGNLLYGFQLAKNNIKKRNEVLIVEGYMDMLAAFQNGLDNVVACNGTALTQKQLSLLKPIAQTLVLGFDRDNAGREASKRAFELALEMNFDIKVLILPKGKDIAEFCQKESVEIQKIYAQSPLFIEALYQEVINKYGHQSISEKRKILSEFGPYLLKIKSSIERDEYVKRIALDLDLMEVQVYDEIKLNSMSKNSGYVRANVSMEDVGNIVKLGPQEILIGLYLENTKLFFNNKINISQDILSENLKTIYNTYQEQYTPKDKKEVLFKRIWDGLTSENQSLISLITLYVGEKYEDFSNESLLDEVDKLVERIRYDNITNLKRRLHRELQHAEKENDSQLIEKVLQEIKKLSFND